MAGGDNQFLFPPPPGWDRRLVVVYAPDARVEADWVLATARAAGLVVVPRCLEGSSVEVELVGLLREQGSAVFIGSEGLAGRADLARAVVAVLAGDPAAGLGPVSPEYLRVLTVHRVDLPAPLSSLETQPLPGAGQAGPLTLVSLVVAIGAVVAAQHTGRSWVPPALLVGLCLALLALQLSGSRWRLVLRATLLRVEAVLRDADLAAVLALAEAAHDRWFGQRILSWKAIRRSAAVSASVLLLLGWAAVAIIQLNVQANPGMPLEQILAWALPRPLLFGLGLLVFNIPVDFLSWSATRWLVRRLAARPTPVRVLAGLGLDLVLMAGLAAAPAVLNPGTSRLFRAGAGWQVLQGAGAHWTLWLTGSLDMATALEDWNLAAYLVVGLAAFTAVLPSLVHGVLMAGALLARLLPRWAPGGAAELVGAAARRPQGPAGTLLLVPALLVAALSARPVVLDGSIRFSTDPAPTAGLIGSPADEVGRYKSEAQREVSLSRPVRVAVTETTVAQWAATVLADPALARRYDLEPWPSPYRDPALPITTMSWCDALRFANLRSEQEGRRPAYRVGDDATLRGCGVAAAVSWDWNADGYRLPTEAEWELAARAGKPGPWAGQDDPAGVAWTLESSGARPRPVALLPANALGLHDMAGNVWEWTWDAHTSQPDGGADPVGPSVADSPSAWRVIRGGSWDDPARLARSAYRDWFHPANRNSSVGFRLVLPSRVDGGS